VDGRTDGSRRSNGDHTRRRIERRAGLPGGRAVLGALLMAASALGVYLAHLEATRQPSVDYVVAARDLDAGQVLARDDLQVVSADLPAGTAERAFGRVDDLVGAVVLAPLGTGDLIQASAVTSPGGAPTAHEVALVLPRAQVAVARLQRGDRVDLYATADGGTEAVVAGAVVVSVASERGGGIAADREVDLVVSLPEVGDVVAVVHALRTAELTVVRSAAGSTAGTAAGTAEGTAEGTTAGPAMRPGGGGDGGG
jgi:hypothetical protein